MPAQTPETTQQDTFFEIDDTPYLVYDQNQQVDFAASYENMKIVYLNDKISMSAEMKELESKVNELETANNEMKIQVAALENVREKNEELAKKVQELEDAVVAQALQFGRKSDTAGDMVGVKRGPSSSGDQPRKYNKKQNFPVVTDNTPDNLAREPNVCIFCSRKKNPRQKLYLQFVFAVSRPPKQFGRRRRPKGSS
jgi:hypothetical protein